MVEFLDRDRRSNSVLPSRFGQGIKPPRRPNFAQNMHPIKWCRRSLARPNRSAPEYHDVVHGVAVGWPRRFCVIAPIAFVGGIGGWCCRTWCAVVFAVVLRSVVVFFYFVCLHTRKEGRRPVTNKNKHKWGRPGGEGKLIMEWEFINSVTIQLAKIVFQNFLCKEIKMKYAEM
jgi:hypothetical protein